MTISQEKSEPEITKISLNVTYLKFCSNISGANETNINIFKSVCFVSEPVQNKKAEKRKSEDGAAANGESHIDV